MRDDWSRVPLNAVLEPRNDRSTVDPAVSYPLAGVYSFGRGLFPRDALLGSKTAYKELHRLHSGQLVMSKLKAWEGALAVVDPRFDGYFLSPEFPTFAVTGGLDPRYLSLICQRSTFWEQLQLESRGMGGRRERVHPTRLLEVVIDLPPIDEQRRIVDLLSAADGVTEAVRTVSTTSATLGQALLDRLLDEAVLNGADILDVRSLATTDGLVGGPFGSSLGAKDYVHEGVPVIRGSNLSTGTMFVGGDFVFVSPKKSQELHRNSALPGDVVVTQRGTIGQVAIVPEADFQRYVVSQSQMRLRVDPGVATPEFAYFTLRSSRVQSALRQRTVATANPHINLGIFASTQVVVPRLSEQDRITELVLAVMDVRERATRTEQRAVELRLRLSEDLLSGAHEITNVYDELFEQAS